ncbi:MAG: ABC transporter ATP-binding protein [Planctomycetaceae bacterium]|nr:ABC transporter ATP-binding protein [Planctomycetaceae bacterium]
MTAILKTFDLGKEYLLGGSTDPYETLRESLKKLPKAVASHLLGRKTQRNTFWALKNVDVSVETGEVVGVIGRNGAGKSTLLKLLTRVTEPTTGGFDLYGRVGSLLEVTAGFHPELTGRENIYLNGTILGMKRAEIRRHFDEIVEFAGIERHLETPVKRYSSGMYSRLAFSVAAHLEAEILLVDEVLAVGDAAFQQKCVGKMGDVARSGRTVLLVSHNMNVINKLCNRVLVLREGEVVHDGSVQSGIDTYLCHESENVESTWELAEAPGDDLVRLTRACVTDVGGAPCGAFDIQEGIQLELEFTVHATPDYPLAPNFRVFEPTGGCVFMTFDHPNHHERPVYHRAGNYRAVCHIPGNLLAEGTYYVTACVSTRERRIPHVFVENAFSFRVHDTMQPGSARGSVYTGPFPGSFRPVLDWEHQVDQTTETSPTCLTHS